MLPMILHGAELYVGCGQQHQGRWRPRFWEAAVTTKLLRFCGCYPSVGRRRAGYLRCCRTAQRGPQSHAPCRHAAIPVIVKAAAAGGATCRRRPPPLSTTSTSRRRPRRTLRTWRMRLRGAPSDGRSAFLGGGRWRRPEEPSPSRPSDPGVDVVEGVKDLEVAQCLYVAEVGGLGAGEKFECPRASRTTCPCRLRLR